MIPFIHFERPFQLLHLPFQVFGALLIAAVWYGSNQVHKRGRELGLDDKAISSMFLWAIVSGFLLAHLFDLVAYQWAGGTPTLATIINPFAGLSSYGGFAGSMLAMWIWCRWNHQSLMAITDANAVGLAPGWFIGRVGCFTAHDHPGRFSNFVLAVRYPDGPRHDLGLYEALLALAVSLVFVRLGRRNQPIGRYAVILSLAYAPARFLLDFLRATDVPGADPRYFGLTPAQYLSLLVLLAGLLMWRWTRAQARAQVPAAA